jgi:hypothetical protein
MDVCVFTSVDEHMHAHAHTKQAHVHHHTEHLAAQGKHSSQRSSCDVWWLVTLLPLARRRYTSTCTHSNTQPQMHTHGIQARQASEEARGTCHRVLAHAACASGTALHELEHAILIVSIAHCRHSGTPARGVPTITRAAGHTRACSCSKAGAFALSHLRRSLSRMRMMVTSVFCVSCFFPRRRACGGAGSTGILAVLLVHRYSKTHAEADSLSRDAYFAAHEACAMHEKCQG